MSITRNKAYSEILHIISQRQAEVLKAIRESKSGMTLFELVVAMSKPINQISGRVTELSKLELIIDGGRRENPDTNKFSTVWIVNKERVDL